MDLSPWSAHVVALAGFVMSLSTHLSMTGALLGFCEVLRGASGLDCCHLEMNCPEHCCCESGHSLNALRCCCCFDSASTMQLAKMWGLVDNGAEGVGCLWSGGEEKRPM